MNKPGLAAAWLGNSHSPKEKPRIFTPEDPGLLFHPVQSNHRGACQAAGLAGYPAGARARATVPDSQDSGDFAVVLDLVKVQVLVNFGTLLVDDADVSLILLDRQDLGGLTLAASSAEPRNTLVFLPRPSSRGHGSKSTSRSHLHAPVHGCPCTTMNDPAFPCGHRRDRARHSGLPLCLRSNCLASILVGGAIPQAYRNVLLAFQELGSGTRK